MGIYPIKSRLENLKAKKYEDKPYSKDKFNYDPVKDKFTCPHGETLIRKATYTNKKKQVNGLTPYYGANCKDCPGQLECTGRKGRVKILSSDEYEPEQQKMALKMETPEAKEVYRKRIIVEQPFGNVKIQYEIHRIPNLRNR